MFFYVSIEERIHASHPDQALDRLNPTFCRLYAPGRPPIVSTEATAPGFVAAGFLWDTLRTLAAGVAPLQPAVSLVCRTGPYDAM
jgi:hypothetical protein